MPSPSRQRNTYRPIALIGLLWLTEMVAAATNQPVLLIDADNKELSRHLQTTLSVKQVNCVLDNVQRQLLERRLIRDGERTARAIGFYHPQLTLKIQTKEDCWQAQLAAIAGPAMIITDRDIQIVGPADEDPLFQQLLLRSALQTGQRLQHADYEKLRDELNRLTLSQGYFDAHMAVHQIQVQPDINQATIRIHLDSGPRYRFGDITLQQSILDDDFVRRYLRFQTGDLWQGARLLESQQALLGSGYFSTVQLQQQPLASSHSPASAPTANATLQLTPRPRYAWLTGVGISTDTGPRLRLGFEDRYINQRGHRWQSEANISVLRQTVSSRYEIPLRDPLRDRLAFSSRYQREDSDTATSETLGVGVSLIGELGQRWILTRSVELERERFTIAGDSRVSELLIPGVQLQKTRSDDLINPRQGWKLGTSVRGTHNAISSSESFAQLRIWGKAILPLGPGRLLTRLETGHIIVDQVTSVPASFRFFAGGDSSLRGFDYQALGPLDNNNEVIGGTGLLVGSVEVDMPISARWHPAIFVDAGNAFNELDDIVIRRSAGIGIRWRSPVGPIRLDLARAVDEGRAWRIHLSMGPDL